MLRIERGTPEIAHSSTILLQLILLKSGFSVYLNSYFSMSGFDFLTMPNPNSRTLETNTYIA